MANKRTKNKLKLNKGAEYIISYYNSPGFDEKFYALGPILKDFRESSDYPKSLSAKQRTKLVKTALPNIKFEDDGISSIFQADNTFKYLPQDNKIIYSENIFGDIGYNPLIGTPYSDFDNMGAAAMGAVVNNAIKHKQALNNDYYVNTNIPYANIFPQFRNNIRKSEYSQYVGNNTDPIEGLYGNPMYSERSAVNLPNSTYTKLMQLRYELYKHGIYDSRKKDNPIKQKQIDQYKQKVDKSQYNNLFQNFTDQQIIDMLNTIAYNPDMDSKDAYYAKRGGNLDYFKNGKKIHIKESQKGSFTKYCGGNVTSECIARGKASPDPRIRKKATFAANARKWKHQWGGMLHKPEIEDEQIEYGPEYWANIQIDPDSLNPYGAYKFGLPAYNDKWYVGDKAGNSQLTFVNNLYNELQGNIRTAYPEYSNRQVDNLADFMVRHYIKENGWRKVNKLVGGYGKATSTQQWINGMKKMYPNAMKANTFEQYINGLKANIQGNKYNSVNPNYFNELLNQFGGNKVRIGRYLKQIRDTK